MALVLISFIYLRDFQISDLLRPRMGGEDGEGSWSWRVQRFFDGDDVYLLVYVLWGRENLFAG